MISEQEINRIKALPIVDYLAALGHFPVRTSGKELCYFSPFRKERTPSFYVNVDKNLFHDFSDVGGDIISLAMKLHGYSFNKAVETLSRWQPDYSGVYPMGALNGHPHGIVSSAMEITEVKPLTHRALINYAEARGIPFLLAAQYLKEVHYTNNGRRFFALGFENDRGGYELRSGKFKGSTAPKGITTVDAPGSKSIAVFEGFFNFLSALVCYDVMAPRQSCIILNSTSNLKMAMTTISRYQKVYAYLDNDVSGKKTLKELVDTMPLVIDQSHIYKEFNDLNNFLMHTNEARTL